jgi:hypothetical protein
MANADLIVPLALLVLVTVAATSVAALMWFKLGRDTPPPAIRPEPRARRSAPATITFMPDISVDTELGTLSSSAVVV